MLRVKNPRDLGAGILFAVIGLIGLYFAKDLSYGSTARMGPGFFPTWLSGIILGMGLLIGLRSLMLKGPPIETIQIRPILCVLASLLAFGYLIEYIGLALSVALMTIIAVQAHRDTRRNEAILLAIGLSIGSVLLFVYALRQAMPPWWGR